MNTSNKHMLIFQKSCFKNENASIMFIILFLLTSNKLSNKLVLNMNFFITLLKLNVQLLENQTGL